MVTLTHLFKPVPDEGKAWCAEAHPMGRLPPSVGRLGARAPRAGWLGTTHPLSTTCLRCLAIALQHFERLAAMPKSPHDEGAAPPAGFTRYRIEMPVPRALDSSDLLERMQTIATELIDEYAAEADDADYIDSIEITNGLVDRIENEVSVQAMEG